MKQAILYMTLGSIITLIILHFRTTETYSPERFEAEMQSLLRDMEEDGLIAEDN
jgi:hypothetical protein